MGDNTTETGDERTWTWFTWAPIVVACAASAALWTAGEAWITRIGVPPESPGWWLATPVSVFTHLDAAHLFGGAFAWWVVTRGWQHSNRIGPRTLAGLAAAAFVSGAAVWAATGDGRALHGSSSAVIALAAALAVCGTGTWRAAGLAVVAVGMLAGGDTSAAAHTAGLVVGSIWGVWHRVHHNDEPDTTPANQPDVSAGSHDKGAGEEQPDIT